MQSNQNKFNDNVVWRADELWRHQFTRHPWSDDQIAELTLKSAYGSTTVSHILQQAAQQLESGCGVFLASGLLPDTLEEQLAVFEKVYRQIGTPISQSTNGERLFKVQNEALSEHDARVRGPNTRRALSFHSDRCDVIGFFCIRQAIYGGENLLVSSIAVHETMQEERPDLLAELYRPYYWKRHTIDQGNQRPWYQLPVFAPYKGRFMANIMRVLILRAHQSDQCPDLTQSQLEALDYLEATARRPDHHVRFHQKPGDMLFLNNYVVLHSRTEFNDSDDRDKRRLLLRVWLSTPNSRELDPVFAPLYGATGAGELRGGIHPAIK